MSTVPEHQNRLQTPPAREPAPPERGNGHRSLPSLLRELRDEAATLIQTELELARTEIAQKISEAQSAIATSAGGLALMIAGLITLCLAATAGLYVFMLALEVEPAVSLWVSPLIVGAVVLFIGWLMALRARKVASSDHWRPRRTERSVRETTRWATEKI